MEISLKLILDELELETEIHLPADLHPKFKSVELYDGSEAYPDRLYISPLSEAIPACRRGGGYFLCAMDAKPSFPAKGGENACAIEKELSESASSLSGIAIVRSDIAVPELLNRVQRVFVKVRDWVMAMERNTARRGGLQELLDLSEPMFKNFITIQDGTFKLIAHTKGIVNPGVIMKRLVEYGYHPPETMDLFIRNRRIEQFKTISDVIVSRDNITSEFDVVKKTFHQGSAIYLLVVMECCGKPADNAVVELFGMLLKYIKFYADLDIAQTGSIAGVRALVLGILGKSAGSMEEARARSTYCGYPFSGGFRLYVFSFADESGTPIASLVELLTLACRDVVVFSRGRHVITVQFRRVDIDSTCKTAEIVLGGTGFSCGISNDFDCLWDLPAAFEQSIIALGISARLKPSRRNGSNIRFRLFSEAQVYHIVSEGLREEPEALRSSLLGDSIEKLRECDERHHTDMVSLLRLFLENKCSATTVAALMHLHRNTVLYHIEKACDLIDVSLKDPDTRLQLLLAFKADDLETGSGGGAVWK